MEEFILERADGTQFRVTGYKVSTRKDDAKEYVSEQYSDDELPPKVDLRKYMTPIEQQGETNSCVANAVAGAYEYLAKVHTGENYDVSRMFIYYNARHLQVQEEGGEIEDEGCMIHDAIKGLQEYGACSEETYPFDIDSVNEQPSDDAYEEASQFLVEDVERVPTTLQAWKHCLAEGHPIIFGINLYQSFDKPRKRGMIPVPSKNEASRASHGGHAMLAVGYSDPDQVFIVRNSWGKSWGDEGYCYIPYDYIINKKFNDGDSWIIRQLENVDFNNEDFWNADDESILEDYDSELSNMTDDEYDALLEAMGDYSFELRIAILFLTAAEADGDLSDDEYDAIAIYLQDVLDSLGVEDINANKVLRRASRYLGDQDLIEETVYLFNEHFSPGFLARVAKDIEQVVGVDDLSDDEQGLLYSLIDTWQIEDIYHDNDEEDNAENEDEDSLKEQRRSRYKNIKAHEDDEEEEDEPEDDEEEEEDEPEDDEEEEEDEPEDDEEEEEDEPEDDEPEEDDEE